jgi:hypothetical protein
VIFKTTEATDPASLLQASGFVTLKAKTTPDKPPRQAIKERSLYTFALQGETCKAKTICPGGHLLSSCYQLRTVDY